MLIFLLACSVAPTTSPWVPTDWRGAVEALADSARGLPAAEQLAEQYLTDPRGFEARSNDLLTMAVLWDPVFREALREATGRRFASATDGPPTELAARAAELGVQVHDGTMMLPTRDFLLRAPLARPHDVSLEPTLSVEHARSQLTEHVAPGTEVIRIRGSYDLGPLLAFRTTGAQPGYWWVGPRGVLPMDRERFGQAMWLAGVGRRQDVVDLARFARVFSVAWEGHEQLLASEAIVRPEGATPAHPAFSGARYRFWLWDVRGGGQRFHDVTITPTGELVDRSR